MCSEGTHTHEVPRTTSRLVGAILSIPLATALSHAAHGQSDPWDRGWGQSPSSEREVAPRYSVPEAGGYGWVQRRVPSASPEDPESRRVNPWAMPGRSSGNGRYPSRSRESEPRYPRYAPDRYGSAPQQRPQYRQEQDRYPVYPPDRTQEQPRYRVDEWPRPGYGAAPAPAPATPGWGGYGGPGGYPYGGGAYGSYPYGGYPYGSPGPFGGGYGGWPGLSPFGDPLFGSGLPFGF